MPNSNKDLHFQTQASQMNKANTEAKLLVDNELNNANFAGNFNNNSNNILKFKHD